MHLCTRDLMLYHITIQLRIITHDYIHCNVLFDYIIINNFATKFVLYAITVKNGEFPTKGVIGSTSLP